jgi:ethanolamine ammonia-lyase large subunit
VETICRLQSLLRSVVDGLRLPTRFCVLSDIVKQDVARASVAVDVAFQSLAGTSAALQGMVGLDVDGILDLARGFDGLYFETGQGSEVTNGTAAGVDMVTLEARSYGVARYIARRAGAAGPKWTIVNDVAGFIGPEVFRTGEQLLRACLEDTVMAKLHGLTMGLDVCSTFHMGIEPDALARLTHTIVELAAPAYLMSVAGASDPMLGYLTTPFRAHPRLRARIGRAIATPMARRLRDLGALEPDGTVASSAARACELYAAWRRSTGDRSAAAVLRAEAGRTLGELQRRGFDLGFGHGPGHADPPAAAERVRGLFRHARQALYAALDEGVLREVCSVPLMVRTGAADRDDYLANPGAGEHIRDDDVARVLTLYSQRRPAVQLVISDGLNAEAVNQNLPHLLPPLRHLLGEAELDVGAAEVVVVNGRVRAGYHVGALLASEVVVHLIGERPGTGLSTLSAYLTYGRDLRGGVRWDSGLEHSCTTAVCGIHPRAKHPEHAAREIARYVARMMERRRSGVALSTPEA